MRRRHEMHPRSGSRLVVVGNGMAAHRLLERLTDEAPVYSAGDIIAGDGAEEATCADPDGGIYRKVVLRDGRLAGVVLVGDAADGGWLFDLMRRGDQIAHLRESLVFGRTFAEPLREAA